MVMVDNSTHGMYVQSSMYIATVLLWWRVMWFGDCHGGLGQYGLGPVLLLPLDSQSLTH